MRVVDLLAKENPGTGSGSDASKYIYYVENLNTGDRVYLQRPANLHNGFDFLVCVENANYAKPGERRRNYPNHSDLGDDLEMKKQENPQLYMQLYDLLKKVYTYHNVEENEMDGIVFKQACLLIISLKPLNGYLLNRISDIEIILVEI